MMRSPSGISAPRRLPHSRIRKQNSLGFYFGFRASELGFSVGRQGSQSFVRGQRSGSSTSLSAGCGFVWFEREGSRSGQSPPRVEPLPHPTDRDPTQSVPVSPAGPGSEAGWAKHHRDRSLLVLVSWIFSRSIITLAVSCFQTGALHFDFNFSKRTIVPGVG